MIYSDDELRRMGDVNGDGIICMEDMKIFQAAYGSKPGSPNWNPACDLNGDGVIDLRDIVVAARNYGSVSTKYFVNRAIMVAGSLAAGALVVGMFVL